LAFGGIDWRFQEASSSFAIFHRNKMAMLYPNVTDSLTAPPKAKP
jgi:hypothetical protein